MMEPRRASIARRLFLWQFIVIAVCAVLGFLLILNGSAVDAERAAAGRSLTSAQAIAHNPLTVSAMQGADAAAELEPYARDVVADGNITFLAMFSPSGQIFSSSRLDGIGPAFEGYEPALAGEEYSEEYVGPYGPAVRSVVPVIDGDEVVGVIVAGVDLDDVQSTLGSRVLVLAFSALGFLLLTGLGAWGLSRYLRRVTWGQGAEELSRMFQFYEGVLHSIDEGLILLDERGRIVLANDRAKRMLRFDHAPTFDDPVAFEDLALPAELVGLLQGGSRVDDEVVVTDDQVLVVNSEPVHARAGGRGGTVVTLRDRTRIQELSGELENSAVLTDALRAQTHEYGNRLHTMISLIELGRTEEALALADAEIGVAQRLADSMVDIADEPVLTALLLGKSAQAHERGIRFDVSVSGALDGHRIPTRELITIVGNLVDNAMDAVAHSVDAWVRVEVAGRDSLLAVTIRDSGPGPAPASVSDLFELGATTKTSDGRPRGVGLALVRQSVHRLGGTISVDGSAFRVELPVGAEVTPS